MGGRVVRVDPSKDPRWDDFVSRHPEGRIASTSLWLEVLRRGFAYEPVALAYEVDDRLEGVLPLCLIASGLTGRRLVSLPFSGPAGPIGTSAEAIKHLVAEASRAAADLGCRHLNIRTGGAAAAAALKTFTRIDPFVSSLVLLEGSPEELWRRIPVRSVRQEIAQGRRRGVSVRIGDKGDLPVFHRLLTATSQKHGIPPPPRRLFDAMWEILEPRGMLHLFLAALGDRVITAQLCFTFRDVVSAGYVGTDYRFLRYHPVKIADWTALAWASERGFRVFDFLQSHVDNHGLRWYKRSFGAEERPFAYYYHPRIDAVASLREVLVGRRSPVSGVVKAVVRRLPAWGLRSLGGLLYRHVG